eukprot:12402539-Heterocapsa_arctica.AAC.1
MAALAAFSLSSWAIESRISATSARWRSNNQTDGAKQKKLTSVSSLMLNFLSVEPTKLARNVLRGKPIYDYCMLKRHSYISAFA